MNTEEHNNNASRKNPLMRFFLEGVEGLTEAMEKYPSLKKFLSAFWLVVVVCLVVSLFTGDKVQDFDEQIRILNGRLDFTAETKNSMDTVGWGFDSSNYSSGGYLLGEDYEGLTIYSTDIYSDAQGGAKPEVHVVNYIINSSDDGPIPVTKEFKAQSTVKLLDFKETPEALKMMPWIRYYRSLGTFTLEPAGWQARGDNFPGLVWFNQGKDVYFGPWANLFESDAEGFIEAERGYTEGRNKTGFVIGYRTEDELRGRKALIEVARRRKGQLFTMPKEGSWTLSLKDGLVRVKE
jgi:hypothetical protein